MGAVVAFISQKGGVGKSTLARAFAREVAANRLTVNLADLDIQQASTIGWGQRRLAAGINPEVPVEAFRTARAALRQADTLDYLVVDGPARASAGTLEIAITAAAVIQPAGASLDDLEPAVREFHALVDAGVPVERLVVALCRITTIAEEAEARDYVRAAGYRCLPGVLRERPAYRHAQDRGKAVTETRYRSLNKAADQLIRGIARMIDGTH